MSEEVSVKEIDILNYAILEKIEYKGYINKTSPEKILQFGEGNFMRAFTDHWIDLMNEKANFDGKVVVVTPILPPIDFDVVKMINDQEGLYTLYLRGIRAGQNINERRIISSVSRCISPQKNFSDFLNCAKNPDLVILTSNTTEAGIAYDSQANFSDAPPSSFPAKMCRFLYERWCNNLPGFLILACELIDNNGDELKRIVLRHCEDWALPEEFRNWINKENIFCSTLVDRIVTGYPHKEAKDLNLENRYRDQLIVAGEIFGIWVIEGPQKIKSILPIDEAGLSDKILVVDDSSPYKQRKVRILNGAHTAFVPAAFLTGQELVRTSMEDEVIHSFLEKTIFQEIIPSITTLPTGELKEFASSVIDRFKNPYIDHQLISICLNTTSKWQARVLPSVLSYCEIKKELPRCLTFSFAAYIAFYSGCHKHGEEYIGQREDGRKYVLSDDDYVFDFFIKHEGVDRKTLVENVCANQKMWGTDLSKIKGFVSTVVEYLHSFDEIGIYGTMKKLIEA